MLREATLLNLLNPKLTLFFVAFLPQFVTTSDPSPALTLLGLSTIFMGLTLLIYLMYAVLADRLRTALLSRPSALPMARRAFALMFVAMAGYVVVATT